MAKGVIGLSRRAEAWVKVWMPEEERYVNEQHPDERADFIVLGYDRNDLVGGLPG